MDSNEDKSDTLSKSKRTFVLGVVDTSGMKPLGTIRKRRWDQPPQEGEEVDGAAPAKLVIKEAAASHAEPAKPKESIECEMQDVFFDTSETILEEIPVEDSETTAASDLLDSSPMKMLAEVSSSIPDVPEKVSSTTSENDSNVTPEQVVEEVRVPAETAPNEAKKTAVKATTPKSQDKKETKIVAPVIISDSLKAIQFCYDEDDSNSSGGSDNEGSTAVVSAAAVAKTDVNTEKSVGSNSLGAEVTMEPSLDTNAPEEGVETVTSVDTTSDLKDEVVIEQPKIDSIHPQKDLIVEDSPVPAELRTKDKSRSRSPTPVLADEQDEDSSQQATEVDNTTGGSGLVQVIEVSSVEEIASVIEGTTMNVDTGKSAIIIEEPVVQDLLQDISEISQAAVLENESVIEPELIVEAAVLEEGKSDATKIEADVANELSLDAKDQQIGSDKLDSFNGKSLMDFLNAPSEQSEASKPIAEPASGKELPEQGQTNLISMDNSQNCCVSFDDMSNLDKTSSKSPELDLRYTDSEDSNAVVNSNPEVTMHFASVRTQDSVLTPDSAQEETEELKDDPALAVDALIIPNPELDDKTLDFDLQTQSQSQTTMEMLDTLVRRSSEDDPSRLTEGGGLFSVDSLINEINLLPDQEDNDKNRESSKSALKDNASNKVDETAAQTVAEKSSEICQPENVVTNTEVSAPIVDMTVLPKTPSGTAHSQEMEKSETCTSVEEEMSQGADGESKNVTVSSANILEVIFGSEQKSSSYPTISSLEADTEVKVEKKVEEEASSKGVKALTDISDKPVIDSKLQLNNEDFEMGSAEIVAVDPTKSLSGEDSDEYEVSSSKLEEVKEKVTSTQQAEQPTIVEVKHVEADDESMQLEEGSESVQSQQVTESITVVDLHPTKDTKVKLAKSKSVAAKSSKASDLAGLEMDESSASNDDKPERMEVENNLNAPVVEKPGLVADEPKHGEASSNMVKEPVPVLIIKKQSLPSKKFGETVETLLTCSPKSMEVSNSPSRKPSNESLHVDTVQESAAETSSPKHSPITLRIYKDNLTVKTDLDSPKRNKSPLSSEFKSELSPRPGFSDNVSTQNKQLEFTLKIAKDANTNQPKATMSPKHVASPTSVWKSEVNVDAAEKQPRSASAATTEKSEKQPRTVPVAAEKQQKNVPVAKPEKLSRPTPTASAGKQPRTASVASVEKQSPPASTASTGKLTRACSVASTEKQLCHATDPEKQPNTTPIAAAEKELASSTKTATEKESHFTLSTGDKKNEGEVKPTPTRGRGRGRGSTARRTPAGRGRRGGTVGQRGKIDEPLVIPDEHASEVKIKVEVEESSNCSAPPSLGLQMTDAFKKMMNQEKASVPQPEVLQPTQKTPTVAEVVTPVVKKRGRPRKSVQQVLPVPEEIVLIKTEPEEPATPVDVSGGETGDDTPSGRPKRTCRGRTKPIVVKKKRGGTVGSVVPRGATTPLPIDPADVKQEGTPSLATAPTTTPAMATGTPDTPATGATTASSPEKPPILAATPTPPARGRGNFKRPTPDRNTLSEKELAELQKIEAKKEKLRLDRIAKYEAKKAKKLAKKLKDEERRKRQAQEKAEKAAAAAPQVFEEETRMSAPDSSSRGHTPAPSRIITGDTMMGDESQNSITTPGDSNRGNKKGRMEISIGDMDCLVKEVRVDDLAEYQWQGSELFMIQEQVSLYLGVKSFKRKYPGLKRRTVEAEERTFLEDSGLVPKSMCDLGITAVSSAEILDIMFQDFPDKYEEFRKHVRDKQAREASYKQKAAIGLQKKDGTKVEPREQALEAVASWNANLNRERKEERKCALDLQTFTVHYPKVHREHMVKPTPKVGMYPVAVIPGQFCDFYKKYTPNELMYFPINTVLYGPLKPNERQKDGSDDGSATESSSSSSPSSSSGESSSESESEGEDPPKCTMCNGTRKKNKDALPEHLLCCILCKTCYHPSCKEFTPEMTPHLVKYEWQCTACKKCAKCRDPNLKDRIMCCQLCDRGYHLSCIGLKKMPEGRWHCTVCAYCSSCGSRNPGGSDWQHEFKKGEKGTKVYQRTLCTPCFKLWRKGKYCQLCSKCHVMKPEEDPNLIQCNSCDRWLHKECYGTKYGIQNKLLSTSSIQCDVCVERIQNSSISGLNRSLIKV